MKAKRQNEKHGMSNTPTHCAWINMRKRCKNSNNPIYKYYGGRGISICVRWNSFKNFYADMGEKPEGLTLERINNDGNYEPGNCEWATWKKQQNNKRSYPQNRKVISCGSHKQFWFRAWHKDMMVQYLSNNQHEFARQHGLRQGSISCCLRGIRHHYHGWEFKKISMTSASLKTVKKKERNMKNITIETKGHILTLTIDLSKTQGPSKSGKSIVIATSGGNKEIAPGIYMGLNIYRKA